VYAHEQAGVDGADGLMVMVMVVMVLLLLLVLVLLLVLMLVLVLVLMLMLVLVMMMTVGVAATQWPGPGISYGNEMTSMVSLFQRFIAETDWSILIYRCSPLGLGVFQLVNDMNVNEMERAFVAYISPVCT